MLKKFFLLINKNLLFEECKNKKGALNESHIAVFQAGHRASV